MGLYTVKANFILLFEVDQEINAHKQLVFMNMTGVVYLNTIDFFMQSG